MKNQILVQMNLITQVPAKIQIPTNPDDQSNPHQVPTVNRRRCQQWNSDEITNPDDGDEISDSDSMKEDSNDESLISLPLIIAILFLIIVVSANTLSKRKEADDRVADAEQREKLERQRVEELQTRYSRIAEKGVSSQATESKMQNQMIETQFQTSRGDT